MNYKELKTADDISEFMKLFNYFHDSCLKELKYVSGSYVNLDLTLSAFDSIRSINAIFHSQNHKLPAIEIVFSKVERLNLVPRLENYDSIILGAHLSLVEDSFYWAEFDDFDYQNADHFNGTWIKCKEIKWRKLDNSVSNTISKTLQSKHSQS